MSERYIPGEVFHASVRKVYDGPLDWAVNKQDAHMARVLYVAPPLGRKLGSDKR